MKKPGPWVSVCAAGVLATLPVMAQESAKPASSGGYELAELVTRFAKRSGKQVVIDPRVRAQVPLAGIDPGEITYQQLLAILYVHQFAAYESAGVLSVVPDANARQFATPVYEDLRFKALDHEVVTLLVQPKNVCAAYLVPVLRPLQPQSAHLAADMQTNTLIVNDRAINVRRIAELIGQLDKRSSGKKDCAPPAPPVKAAGSS